MLKTMNYVRAANHTQAEELRRFATSLAALGELRLAGMDVPLPLAVAQMLREMVTKLAAGEPIALITANAEMTPNEAAAFLNVSRGFITKLLEQGVLPHNEVGSHRRIPSAAVAAYKASRQAKQRAAMEEFVRLSEEMGLYDNPGPPPPKSAFRKTSKESR